MAKSYRDRYREERSSIEERCEAGDISDGDADAFLEFLDAKDPEVVSVTDDVGDKPKSDATLSQYANHLKRTAVMAEFDLTEATADQINRLADDIRSGDAPGVKDEGLTDGSVKNFQSTFRRFYEWLDGEVEKGDIALLNPDESPVDERDLFTKDEIQAVRDAANHPRDRALVDMLFYTGQRLSALLNLRIKDVHPDKGTSGVFYLNTEAGDLKGADGKRPLLYAQKAARDWLNQHPCRDDPDAHFITHKYDWENKPYEPGQRLDPSSIYRQLRRIGEKADVPAGKMNAHNFRHTFVTICKRDYGMDNDTIKRLIGHGEESTIMETTYSHLTDDDVIKAAERATDLRDDEPESSLTPEICDVCGERIERDDAKACPGCGQIFTPDAHSIQEQIDEDLRSHYSEAAHEGDIEMVEALDDAAELLNNPRIRSALFELADNVDG